MSLPCAICFDDGVDAITSFCGPECPGAICTGCLMGYLRVRILTDTIKGTLPVINCPFCLHPVGKHVWAPHAENDGGVWGDVLLRTYSEYCEVACSLLPPCCHTTNYTHLPAYEPSQNVGIEPSTTAPTEPEQEESTTESEEQTEIDKSNAVTATKVGNHDLTQVLDLVSQVECYKLHARVVVNHIIDTWEEKSEEVLHQVLRRMPDEERRATLLLSFLHVRPVTTTRCCNQSICFNCKRMNHEIDAAMCQEDAFDMEQCLVRCRQCRILLLKVQGCDAVRCVCGRNMAWEFEVQLRKNGRRKIFPIDIFDVDVFDHFWQHRNYTNALVPDLHQEIIARRRCRLDAFIVKNKPTLQRMVQRFAVRWRFRRHIFPLLQRTAFWKCYYFNHPEDLHDAEREMQTFLSSFNVVEVA